MFRLRADKASGILENCRIIEKTTETHFLFGRNDVFSFEDDGSVFSVVERPDQDLLIHDFEKTNKSQREVTEMEKDEAVEFLESTGYDPFMRFDISRYLLKKDGKNLIVEKVEQLGYFINDPEIGTEEVKYGEVLKDEMIHDTEKEKKVRREAEEILQIV